MFRFADISDLIPFRTPMSGTMTQAIELWMDMYMDTPPWKTADVTTMNLPALIASELARTATIEMKSGIEGEGMRAKYLAAQYEPVVRDARRIMEYAAAGGSIALKPYISGDSIVVDYVRAGMFWPTAYSENGDVIGISFIDQITKGQSVYIKIEHQLFTPEKRVEGVAQPASVRITNKAYLSDEKDISRKLDGAKEIPLASVDEWADIEPEVTIEGVARPLFTILKMPIANNIEPGMPIGVSAYARAVDLIREADKQFSRLIWEMESGQRAVYVDIRAFKARETKDANGVLPFKRLYRTIDNPNNNTFFQEWTPTLRETEQIVALDEILRRIEDACSLARGTLTPTPEGRGTNARTATELKIMRQRTYAVAVDMQQQLRKAFVELAAAMDVLASFRDGGAGLDAGYTVSFEFDDSVVSDRQAEFLERQQLVAMGVMQPWEMRAWYLDEDEETARGMTGANGEPDDMPGEE